MPQFTSVGLAEAAGFVGAACAAMAGCLTGGCGGWATSTSALVITGARLSVYVVDLGA